MERGSARRAYSVQAVDIQDPTGRPGTSMFPEFRKRGNDGIVELFLAGKKEKRKRCIS